MFVVMLSVGGDLGLGSKSRPGTVAVPYTIVNYSCWYGLNRETYSGRHEAHILQTR